MPVPARPSLVPPRVAILVLSLGLYVSAFAAPYYTSAWFKQGFQLFLAGLTWFWLPDLTFAWWANVVYWVALGYFGRGQWGPAARCGLVAMGLGLAWALLDSAAVGSPA